MGKRQGISENWKGFPSYDRENLPVHPEKCPACDYWREELRLTRLKNERLKNEIRFLQGIPPKNTNQLVEKLRREVKALAARKALQTEMLDSNRRRMESLSETIDRVKAERDALRYLVEEKMGPILISTELEATDSSGVE